MTTLLEAAKALCETAESIDLGYGGADQLPYIRNSGKLLKCVRELRAAIAAAESAPVAMTPEEILAMLGQIAALVAARTAAAVAAARAEEREACAAYVQSRADAQAAVARDAIRLGEPRIAGTAENRAALLTDVAAHLLHGDDARGQSEAGPTIAAAGSASAVVTAEGGSICPKCAEACAALVEAHPVTHGCQVDGEEVAAAIRARGQSEAPAPATVARPGGGADLDASAVLREVLASPVWGAHSLEPIESVYMPKAVEEIVEATLAVIATRLRACEARVRALVEAARAYVMHTLTTGVVRCCVPKRDALCAAIDAIDALGKEGT